jgi:hypothetical protein
MSVDPPSFADVYAAFDRGDRTMAKQLLIAMVRSPGGSNNGQAWWLLAQALDDPEQQADCRRRAEAAGYVPPRPASAPAAPAPVQPAPPPSSAVQTATTAPPLHLDPDFAPATDFVIEKLSQNMDRYELIKAVMVRQGWPYEKAQRCVDYIAVNYHRRINMPSTVLAIIAILLGVLVACNGLFLVADYLAAGRDPTLAFGRVLGGLVVAGRAMWSLQKAGFFGAR